MSALARTFASLKRLLLRPLFVIQIRDGVARVSRGDVPPGFVHELSGVARDLGLRRGTVYGVRARHGITLAFSHEVPAEAHQRMRNVLALHRQRIKGA
jgi:hypothetical protein